ncbi:MAG: phosphatase PAP2 family protein [Candidatus Lokiarchaeota archaeon]|nr:phosphatase PAP2 family protein [Candidatus Lokiarchaeota archaeon]MCK4479828.1 phosphatase PAP2 family protein [Candidatus Lokiarchaeota archaeon]
MSEKNEFLSKKVLMIIGITWLTILLIGLILYFAGLNEAFYSDNSTVQTVFNVITYLGDPIVLIIVVAILYLAYNKKFAKNLTLSLLISYYTMEMVKEIIQDPRPAENIDPAEDYGVIEPNYGFPSGHAQNSAVFWGYIGNNFKNKYKYNDIPIIPVILSGLIFLVAISRTIIGVHDLQDMIGGLLIGIGMLLLYIYLEPILTEKFNKLSFIAKIIITVVVSVALFLVGTFIFPMAGLGLAISPTPAPYSDGGAFGLVGGVLLGFGVGYLLENEYVKYDPSQLSNKKKVLNVIIGLVIVLAIFILLDYLLEINSVFYRFSRYAILAFVLAYVIPLICTKINK